MHPPLSSRALSLSLHIVQRPALLRAKGRPRPHPCFNKTSPVSSLSFDVALSAQKTAELVAAAKAEDWETVKALAGMPGVDVSACVDNEGRTVLYVAARDGLLEVVRLLQAQGAKVDAPNKDGYTPLYIAAQKGHLEVVRFLEAQGAKADAPTNDGRTPLYVAAQNGHLEVVVFLKSRAPRWTRPTRTASRPCPSLRSTIRSGTASPGSMSRSGLRGGHASRSHSRPT